MTLRPASKWCLLVFITTIACSLAFATTAFAQSSTLIVPSDIISTDNTSAPNVYHSLSFTVPEASLAIIASDYIQINLVNFSDVTAATLVGGTYTGTPVFSVSGNTVRVTGINVLPGRRITVEGFTATNPASSGAFNINLSVTQDEAGSLIKNFVTLTATENPGTVDVTANVDIPQARLQLNGFTSPGAWVIFTEGEDVSGTDVAAGIGTFSKLFSAIPPTSHSFSIYSIDTSNRTTSITTVDVNTPVSQTTTVNDILLSPTITISDNSILQGELLYATGSAYPNTTITLFTDIPLRTYSATTNASGGWTYTINNTSLYTPGDYRIYALAQTGLGLQSPIGPSLRFTVTSGSGGGGSSCGDIDEGDLNCDDIINLTDFSILMYYWGTADATADINSDGVVNLTDFSIMMYYWGT